MKITLIFPIRNRETYPAFVCALYALARYLPLTCLVLRIRLLMIRSVKMALSKSTLQQLKPNTYRPDIHPLQFSSVQFSSVHSPEIPNPMSNSVTIPFSKNSKFREPNLGLHRSSHTPAQWWNYPKISISQTSGPSLSMT
jgi:hypothetical protein